MRWLFLLFLALLPTTALPQAVPLEIDATNAQGDTVHVSVTIKRAPPETVTVHDTLPSSLPAARIGMPLGLAQLPLDQTGALYNASIFQVNALTMLSQLQLAKQHQTRVIMVVARNFSRVLTPDTLISVAKAATYVKTWIDSIAFAPYRSLVVCVRTADDIMGKNIWGPGAPYYAQIDSINLLVKQRLGMATPTCPRATPSQLGVYKKWHWLDMGHAQYGFYPRLGEVTAYRAKELAAADSLGICTIFGLNISGDATSPRMTPAQIRVAGRALLPASTGGFFLWWKDAYTDQTDVKAAIGELRTLADTTPGRICR